MPMLRRLAPVALLSLVLAGSACDRDESQASAGATAETPVADLWTLTALESLGEHAPIVAVVRLDAWPRVRARLGWFVPQSAGPAPARATLLLAADLPDFLNMLFGPASTGAPTLPGLDPARRLVLALDEPAQLAPFGLLAAALLQHPGALPGVRHELVLPAVDPAGLAAALAQWFDGFARQEPALAPATPGARAWVTGPGELVAVVPEAEAVRVVGLQRAVLPSDTPIAGAPPELRGELLRAKPPAPARTATLMRAAASEEPLAVLLRPRELPALLQWQRARGVADALAQANHVESASLRRSLLGGLLRCEEAVGEAALEFDEWLLTAVDDFHGVRLRVTAGLTPAGVEAFGPGDASAREPLALRGPAIVDATVRVGFADVPPSATHPLVADPTDRLAACTDVFPYMFFGTPMAMSRQLRPTAVPPFTAQLAITTLDSDGPRGAIALDLPTTVDTGALQRTAGQIVTGFAREPEFHVLPAGDRQRVLVGAGVDPRTVFAETTVPADLVAARVDLTALAAKLGDVAPALAVANFPYRRAVFDLERKDAFLLGELALDDGEELAARPRPAPPTLAGSAPAPAPDSPGLACARTFAAQARVVLDKLREAAPSAAALDTLLAGTSSALRCVADDPTTAAHAPALRRLLPLALADKLADEFHPGAAARALADLCEAGDAIACGRRGELEKLPDVVLPGLHSNCPTHHERYAHRLALAGDRLALDGRPLADAAALAPLLAALAQEEAPSLELALDATTTLAALRPLLAALSVQPDIRLGIVSDHDRGETATYRIPMISPRIAATPPARSQQSRLSPQQRVGALVLAGDGATLRMRTGTTALGLYPYLHATTIEADARERPDNGRPPLVTATETTPWSTVAVALAGTCSPHVLAEVEDVKALLGPPDRTVSILWDPHGPKALSVTPKVRGPNNINSGLFKAKPRVEYCYARALADDPRLAGKVVVEFAVSAAGELGAVTLASSTLNHPTVERCIVGAVERHTSWSSADSDATIRWQFDFTRR